MRIAEERLGQAVWFAGDTFTAADIMMVFPLSVMRKVQDRDISALPNIVAYLKRVGERVAYRAAVAAIGEEPQA